MHGFSIQQIERIQNRALWEVFQWYVHKPSDLLIFVHAIKFVKLESFIIIISISIRIIHLQAERSYEKEQPREERCRETAVSWDRL